MKSLYLLVVLTLVLSTSAKAALVDVTWSGTVVLTGVAGTVDVGDSISGFYSYDDNIAAEFGVRPGSARYLTNHSSTFLVNGLTGTGFGNHTRTFNDPGYDQFDSRGTTSYSGDLIDGFSVATVFVRFTDSTGLVLSSTDLLSASPSLLFDNQLTSRLDLIGASSIEFLLDDYTITGAAAVPIPASVWLFFSGLIGLTGVAKRNKA